jgi:hypothetical protein
MPDPKKYKNQNDFMDDCMHQCVRIENKPHEQAVAQCLSVWREKGKKKKCASELILEQSNRLISLCSE